MFSDIRLVPAASELSDYSLLEIAYLQGMQGEVREQAFKPAKKGKKSSKGSK